jgi:hypothetical protein
MLGRCGTPGRQPSALSDPATPSTQGSPVVTWTGDDEFEIGDTVYRCRPMMNAFQSQPDLFCIRKPAAAIDQYQRLLERLQPKAIVEVGVYEGGSAALIQQLAAPEKLVTIDIERRPSPGIEGFIAKHDLAGSVVTNWGVDQSDGERIDQIIRENFEGEAPLDLVIDDASHLLEESRATFNTLFPRLREGGEYVLEDWSWAHAPIHAWPDETPLSLLAFELMLTSATQPTLVTEVEIDRAWMIIRRGSMPVDPETFDIANLYGSRGQFLVDAMEAAERDRLKRARPRLRRGRAR